MAKDLRRSHRGQRTPTGDGGHGVAVSIGRDLVSAVCILRIGQESFLEPGDEFALETSQLSAPLSDVDGFIANVEVRRNEPPDQRSCAPSLR